MKIAVATEELTGATHEAVEAMLAQLQGTPSVLFGTGDPNGTVAGFVGDWFFRSVFSGGSWVYVKTSGAGTTTGWVQVPTSATVPSFALGPGGFCPALSADNGATLSAGGASEELTAQIGSFYLLTIFASFTVNDNNANTIYFPIPAAATANVEVACTIRAGGLAGTLGQATIASGQSRGAIILADNSLFMLGSAYTTRFQIAYWGE